MSIGTRVRAERKAQRLSQEALARRADVSLTMINRLERSAIDDPHISTLASIAEALGVSILKLIGDEDQVPLAEASPESAVEAEERREREELAAALMSEGTKRAEATEEELKAMSDVMPVATIRPLVDLHLALRSLYEEIASTRRPSAELEEAYKKFEAAVSQVNRQVEQMTHPESGEAYMSRKLFAERRAELLHDEQEERDERARYRGAG